MTSEEVQLTWKCFIWFWCPSTRNLSLRLFQLHVSKRQCLHPLLRDSPPCWLCQQPVNLGKWALPSPYPPDPSQQENSRWQPRTWMFTLASSNKVKGGLKTNTSQTRLAPLARKVEEWPSPPAVRRGQHSQRDVRSCRIYGLPGPSLTWPEWVNQTPDRQQLILLHIMHSAICLQYL